MPEKYFSRTSLRLLAVLFAAALLAACSSVAPRDSNRARIVGPHGKVDRTAACRSNPQSCSYEGNYESGERNFAVQEARRLNQAELERLRRVTAGL